MNKKLNIVFLLDRSGSMRGSEYDTIEGYNSYLKEQRKNNAYITTVLFDDQYEILHKNKNIKEVKYLSLNKYFVRGCTALYDAIGKTINMVAKEVKNEKVLFIITTDGLENASQEFDKRKISELIKKHSNWEFIYIGANIDSYEEASAIGIKRKNTANYSKSRKGIDKLFKCMCLLSDSFYEEEEININWKEDIEKEVEKEF